MIGLGKLEINMSATNSEMISCVTPAQNRSVVAIARHLTFDGR